MKQPSLEEHMDTDSGDRIITLRVPKEYIVKTENWHMSLWYWVTKMFWTLKEHK